MRNSANQIEYNSLQENDGNDEQIEKQQSEDRYPVTKILSNCQQVIFDRALDRVLFEHFYLINFRFLSSDCFEGWVYTQHHCRYKVTICTHPTCSCIKFNRYHVCKHFLFVLKRVFHVDLSSIDLRRAIMDSHSFNQMELHEIFDGQMRRLCSVVPPLDDYKEKKKHLTLKRHSIDGTDACPICFERLLVDNKKLVTCFYSCGKSIHKHCMNEWKRTNGKKCTCPLCQAVWINPSTAQKAVLEHYERRTKKLDVPDKYILCCLYTPSDRC